MRYITTAAVTPRLLRRQIVGVSGDASTYWPCLSLNCRRNAHCISRYAQSCGGQSSARMMRVVHRVQSMRIAIRMPHQRLGPVTLD